MHFLFTKMKFFKKELLSIVPGSGGGGSDSSKQMNHCRNAAQRRPGCGHGLSSLHFL